MNQFQEFENQVALPEKTTGAVINHAFELFQKVWTWGIVFMLIMVVGGSILSKIAEKISGFDAMQINIDEGASLQNIMLAFSEMGYPQYILISSLLGLLTFPMYIGFLNVCHRANSRKPIRFSDLFYGYKNNVGQVFLYAVIQSVIMYVAMSLCIIPVIFVFPFLFLGMPVLLFGNLTAVEALKKSFSIASQNYGVLLGISIVAILIAIAGVFLCGVGLLVSVPFVFIAMYSAYLAFVGSPIKLAD